MQFDCFILFSFITKYHKYNGGKNKKNLNRDFKNIYFTKKLKKYKLNMLIKIKDAI